MRVQAPYVWRPGLPAPGTPAAAAAASPAGYGAARPPYGQPYGQAYGAQARPAPPPPPRVLTEDERRVLPRKARRGAYTRKLILLILFQVMNRL